MLEMFPDLDDELSDARTIEQWFIETKPRWGRDLLEIKRRKQKAKQQARSYRKYLKETCERCGFIPEDKCQLDIDHIDNDHFNDTPDNLRTLCANCHRLVTKLNNLGQTT